ncbi:MAG TPA: hypothetical protein VMW69_15810, partial [Spirochaetia bacterium]|nr:hypothetical protein [Spirochaetia bacterium]
SIHTPAVERLYSETDSIVDRFPPEGKANYEARYRQFISAFVRMEQHGVGPEVMAEAVFRALSTKYPKRRYPVGPKSRLLPFLGRTLPSGLMDLLRIKVFGLAERD